MFGYTGIIKGSKSLDFQFLSTMLIFAEANFSLVENYLGGYYEIVLFVVIGINVALRFATSKKLGSKLIGKKDV